MRGLPLEPATEVGPSSDGEEVPLPSVSIFVQSRSADQCSNSELSLSSLKDVSEPWQDRDASIVQQGSSMQELGRLFWQGIEATMDTVPSCSCPTQPMQRRHCREPLPKAQRQLPPMRVRQINASEHAPVESPEMAHFSTAPEARKDVYRLIKSRRQSQKSGVLSSEKEAMITDSPPRARVLPRFSAIAAGLGSRTDGSLKVGTVSTFKAVRDAARAAVSMGAE